MAIRHKILLLDDDDAWLAVGSDLLANLPSQPEILTANSAKRALTILEAERVRLLICDLKMPRMDGLQMLAIVRRRFPELRTVVLSGLEDEDYRARAYALGADIFWPKTEMQRNAQLFAECLESLLGREGEAGFRGIQSKSLRDILQLECLSGSSTVLRIMHGPLMAKVWIQNGELIDAEAEGTRGEAAFQRLLGWKTGTFENLPAEPQRERTIHKPVNAQRLEAAQTLDENTQPSGAESSESASQRKNIRRLSQLTREGADFVLAVPPEGQGEPEAIGTQSRDGLAHWTRRAEAIARRLGEQLEAGLLAHVAGQNLEHQVLMIPQGNRAFLVGWPAEATGNLPDKSRKLVTAWDS